MMWWICCMVMPFQFNRTANVSSYLRFYFRVRVIRQFKRRFQKIVSTTENANDEHSKRFFERGKTIIVNGHKLDFLHCFSQKSRFFNSCKTHSFFLNSWETIASKVTRSSLSNRFSDARTIFVFEIHRRLEFQGLLHSSSRQNLFRDSTSNWIVYPRTVRSR